MTGEMNDSVDCGLQPHDYLEVKFFLISIVGSLIGFFGIFGNASTALILTRPTMRSPNNLFLTALAVFDSCLLITAFFIYAMEYIIEYTQAFDLYVAWLTYLRFAFALSHISQTGSVYITVSVTIERYLAVCQPKRNKNMCNIGGAKWAILGVTVFAVLFNATKFFELEVILNPLCPDGNNWQSFILTPSMMAANPHYQQIYTLWLTNFVMVFLPFITLLVLNAYIAYTIRRSLKKFDHRQQKTLFVALSTTNSFARGMARLPDRSELKEKSKEATLVSVIIVCIFLICNFWGFVLTFLERIIGQDILITKHHAFYTFSREAINFLAIINSSINFIIYIVFGKEFRKELFIVYGCEGRGITMNLPVANKFNIWRIQWIQGGKKPRGLYSDICGERNISTSTVTSTRSLESYGLDRLKKTRLLDEMTSNRFDKQTTTTTTTSSSTSKILNNGSDFITLSELKPHLNTFNVKTTSIFYPTTNDKSNENTLIMSDEETLC